MDNSVNNNGFDYVDLGLPSGTLWASCNVGASKPSDFGFYFQWGDTDGYTDSQVGIGEGKKKFASDWRDYKWYSEGVFTKYITLGATLELEDDAAHTNIGGDWHIPSREQIKELLDNTTRKWATLDGVSGMTFTSTKDTSKYIFIPAEDDAWNGSVEGIGYYGGIWSSMLSNGYVICGKYLYFYSDFAYLDFGSRYRGLSVRGVIG